MSNDCLMRGEEITGGNWSAHCISTWQWITVCFIVCVRHSFIHPSIHPSVGTSEKRKKADRSETVLRARNSPSYRSLSTNTKTSPVPSATSRKTWGESLPLSGHGLAQQSPPPANLPRALPHTPAEKSSICNGMGRQKSSRSSWGIFLSRAGIDQTSNRNIRARAT